MLNQVILIGHLVNDLELNDKKELNIVLAVPRSFKNSEGIYETDFINCKVYADMANSLLEYCKKGDILGVRGRLQVIDNNTVVVTERVTFLSSN